MRQILFATAAAVVLAGAGAAQAQQQTSQVSELVITGGLEEKLPEELNKTGVRVETITGEQIRDGGYLDVVQTLQALTPSANVVSVSGPFNYFDMSLQGGRTQDVLFLLDGVRLNNRLYPATMPDSLPASMIERVEVLEGGQALFYGTQALSGAVNIVTHPFSDEQTGSVTVGVDSWSGIHADGVYANRFGGHQIVAFASYDKSDGAPAFPASETQPSLTDRERGYDVTTVGGKYAYNFGDRTKLSASYIHTDAALDFVSYPARYVLNQNYRNEDIVIGKLEHELTDKVQLFLKGYYHNWDSHYSQINNSLTTPGATLVLEDNTAWAFDDKGLNALARIDTGPLLVFLGYDYQTYGGKDDYLIIAPQRGETRAGFVQVRTSKAVSEKGNLSIGLRHNRPSFGEVATVWNVSGQYEFSPSLFVRGTVGTNFRLPTAAELFAQDYEIGDPNLKPERSTGANLSVGGAVGRLDWEVTAFGQDIEDRIGYDPVNTGPLGEDLYANVAGTIEIRGYEALVRARLTPALNLQASYAHTNSELNGGGVQEQRIPLDIAKATLAWSPEGQRYGGTVSVNWTGDIFTNVRLTRTPSVLGCPIATAGCVQTINYGDFFVANASFHYDFGADRDYRLNVSVENLFDEEYGRPVRACRDRAEGPYDCGDTYVAHSLALSRTVRVKVTKSF